MNNKIIFEKDNKSVKNPKHLQRNVFFALFTTEKNLPDINQKIDTEIFAFLPKNSKGYVTSRFRSGEINEIFFGLNRLWLEILNKSLEDTIEIKKEKIIRFFVVEPENFQFDHVPYKMKAKKKTKNYSSKDKKTNWWVSQLDTTLHMLEETLFIKQLKLLPT